MPQLSGLKRSMPCEDLCSMSEPTASSSFTMKPHLIKDYDSDDASATSSIMELSSLLKLNSRMIASYSHDDHYDTFIDDVWDFHSIGTNHKRQKLSSNFDAVTLCPATEALSLVLEESQVTLDKLMDMHIQHRVSPVEPSYQSSSSCSVHPFSNQSVMNLTRLTGTTMV